MGDKVKQNGYIYFEDIIRNTAHGEELPVISLFPTTAKWNGDVVIWIDGKGKQGLFDASGNARAAVLKLLDGGASIVTADLFQQGEFLVGGQPLTRQRSVRNTRESAAYTFAYNDTLFVRRVHDVLTLLSWIRNDDHQPKRVNLLALNGTGAIGAAARVMAGSAIDRLAIDTNGFRFADVTDYRSPDFLPGAVKYGDLHALLALSSPHPLWFAGEQGKIPEVVLTAYSTGKARLQVDSWAQQSVDEAAVRWILAK